MNNNPFRLFVLVAIAMVAIWFFFLREKGEVQAQEGYFYVGQTIPIPYPDEPSESFSLLIIDVTEHGEFSFVDPDYDVFTCVGDINQRNCSSPGVTCPPGIRALARVPKLNENLLLACMSWADLKD